MMSSFGTDCSTLDVATIRPSENFAREAKATMAKLGPVPSSLVSKTVNELTPGELWCGGKGGAHEGKKLGGGGAVRWNGKQTRNLEMLTTSHGPWCE